MKLSLGLAWVALIAMPWRLLIAAPVSAPPAVFDQRSRAAHGVRPSAVQLQYSIGEPTDEEQLFLEYINRARENPTAEGKRLATTSDPKILDAFQIYQVDLAKLQTDLSTNLPSPPLSFEPHLIDSARGHSLWMLNNAWQAHEETNPVGDLDHIVNTTFDRILAAGYDYSFAGENVYAYSDGISFGHAGFEVDWGVGPGGVQEELGHRNSNHNPSFTEVGIGIFNGTHTSTAVVQVSGTNTIVTNTVGPQVVTVDFGSRFDQPALATGVAYYDLNNNQFYDLGEGLSGVRVEIDSGSNFAISSQSGGYSIPAVEGPQLLTFSGPGLTPVTRTVTVNQGRNIKSDLRLPYTAPVVTPSSPLYAAVPNVFLCTSVPLATSYDLESGALTPFSAALDPKNGLGAFQPQVTTNAGVPAYSLILGDFFTSTLGFHLASASTDPQRLVLGTRLRVGAASKITFGTELAVAGTNQYARLEISSDGGSSWTKLWEQQGRAINNSATIESKFTTRTVSLADYAGWECLFRFSYVVEFHPGLAGSYLTGTGKESGFFFNAVSFSGVDQMTPQPTNSIPSSRFAVTPSALGSQYFRVRPRVGTRSFPPGPIAAATVVAAPSLVHLTNTVSGNGTVQFFPAGGTYAKGSTVTLTAVPDAGWAFSAWGGAAGGATNPLTLTLGADTKITSTFVPKLMQLATSTHGNGTISVSPSPGPYPSGTLLTLTATPASGWKFTGWSGAAAGTANPLVLSLSADSAVVATFEPVTLSLATAVEGQGTVAVSPTPGPYAPGMLLTLTATPAPGWTFVEWSGGASGGINPLPLTLNSDTAVTATFVPVPVNVSLTTSIVGTGSVGMLPAGGSYLPGTPVTLTAVAGPGFAFAGWSGGVSGTNNPITLTVVTNSEVTATFTAVVPAQLGIQGLALAPDGTLRLDFSLTQGSGSIFVLETSPIAGGAWTPLAVPMQTNGPGAFSFQPIVPGGPAAFYRVRLE